MSEPQMTQIRRITQISHCAERIAKILLNPFIRVITAQKSSGAVKYDGASSLLIPEFTLDGVLPLGIHSATLSEVLERFGGPETREMQGQLLQLVVEAALHYPTIKRILVWGSFVTAKPVPNDLDYSVVVSVAHRITAIQEAHRRFLIPFDAKQFYGTDTGYLLMRDYPLEKYTEQLDFGCHNKRGACGIIEINLWGEAVPTGETE